MTTFADANAPKWRFDLEQLRDRLRLERFGSRFALADTERAYRRWHLHVARPFMRVGLAASLVAWGACVAVAGFANPAWLAPTAALAATVMIPVLVWSLITTYVQRLLPLMLPSAGIANILAGLAVVWASAHIWNRPAVSMGGVIMVAYFGYVIFRFHVAQAALTVAVYVTYHEWTTWKQFVAGELSRADVAVHMLMPLIAVTTGLLVSAVLDRVTRERYVQERVLDMQSRALDHERRRADDLLYNMLPERIAERLKQDPGSIAEHFDDVTVLFADIVGFTPLAETTSPEELVALLNRVFARFDELAVEHGVEKIKTIGDAYMAVAGVPRACDDHTRRAADLALALRDATAKLREETGATLQLRIGLHSGSVVAGVIGRQKLAYDLWGDVVNTAARMESHGVAGSIQVSNRVRASLGDDYVFRPRGEIDVKGKGRMTTWLLERH